MRVSLSEPAQDDANAAIDWYIGQGAYIAADDFANALEQAFGLLSGFPHVGAQAAHNTRVLTLRSFPYSVFYRIQHNEIRVVAVALTVVGRGIGVGGGRWLRASEAVDFFRDQTSQIREPIAPVRIHRKCAVNLRRRILA